MRGRGSAGLSRIEISHRQAQAVALVRYGYFARSPLQPGWPHLQAMSAVSLLFSQWVLQYFLSVMQVQAGWAHFF